jgi:alpha-beta hydrolase superfamily lysophospholipase
VLDERWHAQEFETQVIFTEQWLGESYLAIGHSFGAWLLLCAACQLVKKAKQVPRLLLLAPVLGMARLGMLGFIAPRSRPVRSALGLDGRERERILPVDRIEFVLGAADKMCSESDLLELKEQYAAKTVPGGHRMEQQAARTAIQLELSRLVARVQADMTTPLAP